MSSTVTQQQPSIPGLAPIPFIGSKLAMIRFFSDPIGILQTLHKEHGDIASLNRGDLSFVCAFGPEHNQQLLSNARAFHNFAELPVPLPQDSAALRFNTNLTAMNGKLHRQQRRLMMPAFHKKTVDSYRDDMVAVAEHHFAKWPINGRFDLKQALIDLTLDVMMKSLFGLEIDGNGSSLGHLAMEFLTRITSMGVMAFPVNLPGTPFNRFLTFCEEMEQEFLKIIRERRAMKERPRDVLSILIDTHDEDGANLTDEELVGQTGLLFVAGHETTAFTLIWTLFLLMQHPRVYANLLDELEGKVQGRYPTIAELNDLPLLDAVLKESMRLIPATPFLFVRRGTEPFQLGSYQFPADAKVIVSPLVTHHMPELYPEPERFKPERWFSIKPTAFEYLPFGAGPRMCIGAGFATLEAKLVLSAVVQRFRLTLADNLQVDHKVQGITLGPKQAIPTHIFPQDRQFGPPKRVTGTVHELVTLPKH
ncbi:MAG: cytochrome P450 [Chloroflexota bacterium]